ncbi:MAG: sugar kinase, partial [Oscillospiraceae bacterium]|nr:sugar kinase [Oscillospiraceae bacterium]
RAEAREAMTELCQYVDVCISNEEDAKDVFGIEAEATDIYAGSLNHEGYKSVAKQLADKFGFEMVAITLRESHSAFDNGWSAMLYNAHKDEYCFSKKYNLHIIDRVGGGDSFGGGLIYSLLSGKDTQAAVEFAVAASALKHSIEGDYNMVSVAEVEKLAGGDGSGRIQR